MKEGIGEKIPLVLFMCGTTCGPVDNTMQSGSILQAENLLSRLPLSLDFEDYRGGNKNPFETSCIIVQKMLKTNQ